MKVLLVCAGGMSTSVLMKKIEAYAAEHGIEPFEIEDEKTKKVIKANRYIVRTVDEDGKVYECTVKPSRTSDRSMLQMLLAE